MSDKAKILFEKLKEEVKNTFLQEYSTSNSDISQWKGLDIIYFQEHLRKKVKGNVSEKWFYTYFKSDFEKLPRIDMLNLLSQYCNYLSWADFVDKNNYLLSDLKKEEQKIDDSKIVNENIHKEIIKISENKNTNSKIRKVIYAFLSILLIIATIFGIGLYIQKKNTYKLFFFDSDRSTIIKSKLDLTVLKRGFSPEYYSVSNGNFIYNSRKDTLNIIVNSPIYKKDTFSIGLKELRNSYNNSINLKLRPDDYAIMLNYYSKDISGDEDKKMGLINKRRDELNKLIADNASIYQVYDSDLFGMEILDKKKYIDFMTTPTTSLKNYVLISSETKNNKIISIKFKIQKDEK